MAKSSKDIQLSELKDRKRQTMRLPLKQTPLFYERRGFLHSSGRLSDHGIK